MADQQNQNNSNFDIPKFVQDNYPDLIQLVLNTKSMNPKEKQYWFHILPIMSKEQISKLEKILNKEKAKLAAIDKEYTTKLNDIQSKRISHWEEESYKQKIEVLKEQERTTEEEEKQAEENLLKQLEGL